MPVAALNLKLLNSSHQGKVSATFRHSLSLGGPKGARDSCVDTNYGFSLELPISEEKRHLRKRYVSFLSSLSPIASAYALLVKLTSQKVYVFSRGRHHTIVFSNTMKVQVKE